jgi:hypothetical protein
MLTTTQPHTDMYPRIHCMSSNAAVSMYPNNALQAANRVGYKPSLTALGLDLLWHVCSPN